jgi:hypothetical protein
MFLQWELWFQESKRTRKARVSREILKSDTVVTRQIDLSVSIVLRKMLKYDLTLNTESYVGFHSI